MKTIWPLALLTFKDGLRYRILYGILVFAFFLMFFALLISGLFMRDILKIILDICLSAVSLGGLLIPIFLSINLLSGDIEHKTIYTILARPISRTQYILGKFLGLVLLTSSVMIILTGATMLTVWGATFTFAPHFLSTLSVGSILISCFTALLGVLVLQSTVFLWSSVTTSSFLATLLTLATYLIGQTVEDIVRFMSLKGTGAQISPGIQKTVHAVMYVFPNLAAFDLKKYAAYGIDIPAAEVEMLMLYSITYVSVALILAVLVFQKRDLA
ncbi:MAG: ABC transporter permease [Desulfobulbaceae bacterium]|nr:ABC transporter permease [Desulfobulbaceae bacterium]